MGRKCAAAHRGGRRSKIASADVRAAGNALSGGQGRRQAGRSLRPQGTGREGEASWERGPAYELLLTVPPSPHLIQRL